MSPEARRDYDEIVVGLGGIGSGTAYWLARRGRRVLGLEQFELGHDYGASHDHSRIIRLSYHRPDYVELSKRSYETWAEVAEDAGEQLVFVTGGLDLAHEGRSDVLDAHMRSMEACGVPFERLDADEITRRWPQFRLPADIVGSYQKSSGFVAAARANSAHQRLARAHGADLRERMRVDRVASVGGEVEVAVGDQTFRAGNVILAMDGWSNNLLGPLGNPVPLEVTREQVVWYRARDPEAFAPDRCPVWIWDDDPCFYGLPTYGEAGPKIGEDHAGQRVTPDDRSFEPDRAALPRLERFIEDVLPGMRGPIIRIKTCLYTLTPDREFVIDRVPGHPNVLVALGAAHAYKFASQIGRCLAELAIDGAALADLSGYRLDRPALTDTNFAKVYLI